MARRIRDGFLLREVAGEKVVIAVGEAAESFRGMVELNDTGAVVWQELERGSDDQAIAQRLTQEFEVTPDVALADVRAMVAKLDEAGFLA